MGLMKGLKGTYKKVTKYEIYAEPRQIANAVIKEAQDSLYDQEAFEDSNNKSIRRVYKTAMLPLVLNGLAAIPGWNDEPTPKVAITLGALLVTFGMREKIFHSDDYYRENRAEKFEKDIKSTFTKLGIVRDLKIDRIVNQCAEHIRQNRALDAVSVENIIKPVLGASEFTTNTLA